MSYEEALIKVWPLLDKALSLVLLVVLVVVIRWVASKFKEINENQKETSRCVRLTKDAVKELEKNLAVQQERSANQKTAIDKLDREFDKVYARINELAKGGT